MKCKDCKFARWEKTAAGRLSPKGRGVCTWEKIVLIPPKSDGVTTVVFRGGWIWRNDQTYDCPVGIPKPRRAAVDEAPRLGEEITEQEGGQ